MQEFLRRFRICSCHRRKRLRARDFEPKLALLGGETGVEIVARIVATAPDYLKSGGKIFVEMSPTTASETARLFEADGRWTDVAVLQDFAKLDRFVSATLK